MGGPMPAERLPMRKIREVLRLKYACGASDRVISRSLGIGRTAIAEYVRRAAVIGITWPIPEEIDDTAESARKSRRRATRASCSRAKVTAGQCTRLRPNKLDEP